ncbi:hypothetical protein ABKN59_001159 [Abortiporus biennis]
MDSATPRPHSSLMNSMPRKRGPPAALRIDTPSQSTNIVLTADDNSATPSSNLSSATSDSDSFVFPTSARSRSRNMKKLSLTLPSAQSSTNSLVIPATESTNPYGASTAAPSAPVPRRRLSIVSLPNTTTSALLHRKDEEQEGSPTVPYADGPVQILPGLWLGSEDNTRDYSGLMERGIKSILNVAKEVTTVFDTLTSQPLRPFMSTPDLTGSNTSEDPTYYPAHIPSGRPAMHYLKLPWSHGQSDLVRQGFPAAFKYVDQALERGDGVLIHCQCGVSRSATLMIALVMRAAAQCSPNVSAEVWALKGMQGAYSFVKEKSKWVGPNMSLIYQLLDYERSYKRRDTSPTTSERSSFNADEEEWGRQRQQMEEADTEDNDLESIEIMREARALDKAMEDRLVARKTSNTSLGSTASTGLGMGEAWRNRYGNSRKRKGSIASVVTSSSILSEQLVEEDEEEELLGVGRGFASSTEPTEDEASSAAHRSTFLLPPVPATAFKATFGLPSKPMKPKTKRRPPPLIAILPPVPSSPVTPVQAPPRVRAEGRKPELPPLQLRRPSHGSKRQVSLPVSATPSQTLFVFPPSPTANMMRTPSTMTLTSSSSFSSSGLMTPRVSTSKVRGRPRSFINLGIPPTPTTASSRVDARGWVGL